jgi:hypothetical protein
MSLRKNRPIVSPTQFLAKINTQLFPTIKSIQNKTVTSEIFKKLPKENNNPLGENSPNLVTLVVLVS